MDWYMFLICSVRIPGSHCKSDPRFPFGMIVAETENIPFEYSAGYLPELILEMITWFPERTSGNTWWDYFKYDLKLIGAQIMDQNFNILPVLFLNMYTFCSILIPTCILRSYFEYVLHYAWWPNSDQMRNLVADHIEKIMTITLENCFVV